MADVQGATEAGGRVAEALLRGSGGRIVLLRVPLPAASGDEAEEMGLAAALFQDVELGPCAFRKAGSRRELLVSAAAVATVVGSLEFDSAAVLFRTAAGVVVDSELLEIESMVPVETSGVAACYRVKLRA
jgi:hypothetical protein